ncbi:acetyl-CoA carboxylase biotin carboxyl carrier protein [Niallia endozanthoxylica]|uniref:Biotin carboxyl carrier protein of acetyl-CoA carboxylase n=1 Tax=Niallia endozanthoxylica TaxID=2036016 RepID=A0A5J5HYZ3_9BACI|nr:acetyl-CoA carboxylase biotin carboxyl carrier protein [Niallia endozanthoxylica]KAA9026252.1 acetyl-CoA carboxylase biotin carboxyl carrier protein [Niallia endozanthoxylica]
MLKVQEIRELIKLIDHSSIEEFTFEHDGSKIKMKKNTGTSVSVVKTVGQPVEIPSAEVVHKPVVQEVPVEKAATVNAEVIQEKVEIESVTDLHKITSPMVGTFYESPTPDTDAYVKVGSKVSKDSIVCIVEAMKLFNEIEAEVEGEIVEVLVKNGQLVEFGQPLFLVKPE